MKSHSIIGAAALAAWLMAQPAFAYQLSPSQTVSSLTGQLQFLNAGAPFACTVRLVLNTHGKGHSYPKIEKTYVKGRGECGGVVFSVPWEVEVQSGTGGIILGANWSGGSESCSSGDAFTDDKSGTFTIRPRCLSGTLQSNPPIVIVP